MVLNCKSNMTFVRWYYLTLTLMIPIFMLFDIGSISTVYQNSFSSQTSEETVPKNLQSAWKTVQKDRIDHVNRTCEEMSSNQVYWRNTKLLDGYIYDSSTNLAYCHIPKVASTWWLGVFAKSYGVSEDNITRLIQQKQLHLEVLKNSVAAQNLYPGVFKFLFVRHPLTRLVSAYINKYLRDRELGFIKDLAEYLSQNNRKKLEVTFPNFVDFVLDEAQKGNVSYGTLHWIPYYSLCNICDKSYDMVGKLETFSNDVSYLFSLYPYMWDYANLNSKRNTADAKVDYRHYLDQLTLQQKMALCDLYRWDFKMFNYTCF